MVVEFKQQEHHHNKIKFCQFVYKIPKKYIISHKNETKEVWDFFILVLAVYNSFLVPYQFSFKPYFLQSSADRLFTLAVDLIFLSDLILGFFTTFQNNKGEEEFNSHHIFNYHVKKYTFYTDFLSILGNSIFQQISTNFKTFQIFKIFRIFKLNVLI